MINHGDTHSGCRPTTDSERAKLLQASTRRWSSDEDRALKRSEHDIAETKREYDDMVARYQSHRGWKVAIVTALVFLLVVIAAIASM